VFCAVSSTAGPPAPTESAPRDARARHRPSAKRVALIALAVLVFLAISALIARFFTPDNLEREKDLALIRAETRGDAAAIIRQIDGCAKRPACVALARRNASDPRLRRAGNVKILSLSSQTANSPTGATGTTRLAWTVIGQPPVVQCIDVRRTGNAITGVHVKLLGLSAPIPGEARC
jgi:hypothetical protein